MKRIEIGLGKRRNYAKLDEKTFELGEVQEITFPSKDWQIKIAYKNNKGYRLAPTINGLECFIGEVGEEIGRLNYDFDKEKFVEDYTGVIVKLKEKYNLSFIHSD